MDITHQGGASFLITANPAIAINPGEKTSAIVLHTDRTKAAKQMVCGPGEYEIRGALIVTVPAGPYNTRSLAHAVDLEGINIVFAPSSLTTAEEGTLSALGTVDVLIVNADDVNTARTLVRDLGPRVVIPFGSGAGDVARAVTGKEVQPVPRFAWNGTGTPPKAVLLKANTSKRKAA